MLENIYGGIKDEKVTFWDGFKNILKLPKRLSS